jgi:dihydroflavonol-4-reductase
MNALVTGASGFVGGHLCAVLAGRGWRVRAFDLRPAASPSEAVEFRPGDIRDEAAVAAAVRGMEVVFHLASALGSSRLGEDQFLAVNAGGTRMVLKAARASGVRRVVHFSSAGVLGHVRPGDTADETYPLDPRDAYDRTKLAGERAALEAAAGGLDVVVVRPGWVYGPGDRRTLKLIRAVARRRFVLAGRGATLQTPVFVDDLTAGTFLAAEKGRRGEVYNLAGSEVLSVREMVAAIAGASGTGLRRFRLPLGPTRAAAWTMGKAFAVLGKEAPLNPSRLAFFVHPKPLDIAKARTELGYAPAVTFAEGLARTVAWYRTAGWI